MLSSFLPYPPFPWQQRLFDSFVSGHIPSALDLPTGTGKTSVITIWLAALSVQALQGRLVLPRRLVYIVNRRTIVDQATRETERLLACLQAPELAKVRAALQALSAIPNSSPIAASTLRGELADNGEWKTDPSRPAIILGTVDMILSKLLFRGYGDGKRKRVIHAGLLGHDTLLVHDESHLVPVACETLERLVKLNPNLKPINLSATQRSGLDNTFRLDLADLSHEVLMKRTQAYKRLKILPPAKDEKSRIQTIVDSAVQYQHQATTVVVFLYDIRSVQQVAEKLKKQVGENNILILAGRLRGYERDQLVGKDLWQHFSPEGEPATALTETAYLITTSAGEVGVDLDAEHAVADLTVLDSMIQRFGRVNRRGESDKSQIEVVYSEKAFDKQEGVQLQATLRYLQDLRGNASPAQLAAIAKPADALLPMPAYPELDEWILDELSATSLPCRYPIRDFIHGLEVEQPHINLVWRQELNQMKKWRKGNWMGDYLELLPVHRAEQVNMPLGAAKNWLKKRLDKPENRTQQVLALTDDGIEWLRLDEILDERGNIPAYHTLIMPTTIGGLNMQGLPDEDSDAPVTDVLEAEGVAAVRRYWAGDAQEPIGKFSLRGEISPPPDADGDAEMPTLIGVWLDKPEDVDRSFRSETDMLLPEHLAKAEAFMRQIAIALQLPTEWVSALCLAARWHDKGKDRRCWQQAIGNKDLQTPLAKTGHGRYDHTRTNGYRHEFGSLLDALQDTDIQQHPLRELILHLIVSHHGWGRPHVPERGWDRLKGYRTNQQAALDVMNRFDRCQQDYGWWQLAWLEALLGAADVLASIGEKKA